MARRTRFPFQQEPGPNSRSPCCSHEYVLTLLHFSRGLILLFSIDPVTGKKSIFVNKTFTKRIVDLTVSFMKIWLKMQEFTVLPVCVFQPFESDTILNFLFHALIANHDLQARVRWEQNDLAIWDNRSNFVRTFPSIVPY